MDIAPGYENGLTGNLTNLKRSHHEIDIALGPRGPDGDPDDLAQAHAAQDRIKISGGGEGPFEAPNWDTEQLAIARKALNDLAVLGFDTTYSFGRREEDRPIDNWSVPRPVGADYP